MSTFALWPRRRVPLVLQSEAAECGLACLAMVAGFHGLDTDLLTLRRRFEVSARGATLASLIDIADAMGMNTRALRLDLEELPQLQTPCLLHWDLNHFVVLEKADARRITVLDPAVGRRSFSLKEASPHFTGVALELTPSTQFQRRQERTSLDLRVLFTGQGHLWKAFGQMVLLSLVLELFTMLMPMVSQWVLDDVVVTRDAPLLTVLALALFLLAVMSLATRLLRQWVVLAAGQSWRVASSTHVFRWLLRLPLSWFDKRHTGDVLSRMHSVQQIQDTLTRHLVDALLDGLVSVLTLGLMFLYSPLLAGIVLAAALAQAGVRMAVYGPYRQASEEAIVCEARAQTFLLETLRGMAAIKFFARPGWRTAGWMNQQAGLVNATVQQRRIELLYEGINGVLGAVEQALVLYLAARMILADQFSIGMMVAFLAWKGQFLQRSAELVERLIHLRLLKLQGERLADIVLSEPEVRSAPEAAGLLPRPGTAADADLTLELRDVTFRYHPDDPPVLDRVNLVLRPGQAVAVVGPSGCGKSTLLKVLSGQVAPESGEVLLGGVPLRRLGADTFRSALGTVFQDDSLFTCSIFDNIAMHDADATPEKVAEAARLACLHDDILRMPMGYQTLVGSMGATLSGGQKQRLLLARALYKQPRFLLLDEYTSHLDFGTEAQVQAAINGLGCGRFIITHRQHSLSEGDAVMVLWGGRLMPLAEFEALRAEAAETPEAAPVARPEAAAA